MVRGTIDTIVLVLDDTTVSVDPGTVTVRVIGARSHELNKLRRGRICIISGDFTSSICAECKRARIGRLQNGSACGDTRGWSIIYSDYPCGDNRLT